MCLRLTGPTLTPRFSGAATSDARGVAFNGRIALADESDGYLRLNNSSEFTNGIYTPGNLWVNGDLTYQEYIRHQGDSNTYIRFVAADDMQLVAGGRQMIRMDRRQPDRSISPTALAIPTQTETLSLLET